MRQLVNTVEAAKILTISRDTLSRLIRAGEIPFFKLGGQYRFDVSDLEDYIERQRTVPVKKEKPARAHALAGIPTSYTPGMKVV